MQLLSIDDLSKKQIEEIFVRADYFLKNFKTDANKKILNNKTIINLFFENSTRTLSSFELAAKRLGADVINILTDYSSLKKGETLNDTTLTLKAMEPDAIIIRHSHSGSIHTIAKELDICVINAGDGSNEHPTQALLDCFTITKKKKAIKNLNVVICGDILHSRVARSNIKLLSMLGANLKLIAPRTLLPNISSLSNVEIFDNMDKGLKDADVIMMLRLQKERMQGNFIPSFSEFSKLFGLNEERLKLAKKDALIMHPGPVNRGVEISHELMKKISETEILAQVKNGVAIRMAALELLLTKW